VESVDHLLLHCDVVSAIWSVFLVVLEYPGLCLDVLSICLNAGDPLAGQRVLRCEKWCLHASFGVYGGK
jgi:hypothetical protein